MLDHAGSAESIRTVVMEPSPGHVTLLKTRGGMPHFSTSSTGYSAAENDRPVKHPDGGFLIRPANGDEVAGTTVFTGKYIQTVRYKESNGSYLWYSDSAMPSVKKPRESHGHVSWRGEAISGARKREVVLSWDHGLKTRYRIHCDQDCSGRIISNEGGAPILAQSGMPGLWMRSKRLDTSITVGERSIELNVVGAAIFDGRFVFVSHIDLAFVDSESIAEKAAASSKTATVFYGKPGNWRVAGKHKMSGALKAPWFFSPDGSSAACVYETSYTNQKLLTIKLSLVGDFEKSIQTSMIESALSTTPFNIETTLDPVVEEDPGETGWKDPGGWVCEESGSMMYGVPIDDQGNLEARSKTIDWRSGSTPGATLSIAIELVNHANSERGGTGYVYGDYRVADAEASFASSGSIKSQGVFQAGEIYMMGREFGAPNLGQTNFRAYRNTKYVSERSAVNYTYTRTAQGKRYIAADFLEDGSIVMVREEIVCEGVTYTKRATEEYGIEHNRTAFYSQTDVSYHRVENKYSIGGKTDWVVKIGEAEVIRISGGKSGVSNASYLWDRNTTSITVNGETVSSEQVDTIDYSPTTGRFITERGWIVDMDARTSSVIYEKQRVNFDATPIIRTSDELGFVTAFGKRIPCITSSESTLCYVHKGVVIHESTRQLSAPGAANYLLRPHSAMMQLMPRLHSRDEKIEEDTLLQYLAWVDWPAELEAYRYFYFGPMSLHDPYPHGGVADEVAGQLQVRSDKSAIFSSGNRINSYIKSGPLSSVPFVKVSDQYYVNKYIFNGVEVPFDQPIKDAVLLQDSYAVDGQQQFRIYPVRSV